MSFPTLTKPLHTSWYRSLLQTKLHIFNMAHCSKKLNTTWAILMYKRCTKHELWSTTFYFLCHNHWASPMASCFQAVSRFLTAFMINKSLHLGMDFVSQYQGFQQRSWSTSHYILGWILSVSIKVFNSVHDQQVTTSWDGSCCRQPPRVSACRPPPRGGNDVSGYSGAASQLRTLAWNTNQSTRLNRASLKGK